MYVNVPFGRADATGVSDPRGDVRQVKGTIAKTVLSYVRRVLGDEAAAEVLARAVDRTVSAGLAAPASWTTMSETVAIAEAAAAVCGDLDIGRRAGEELMRKTYERGTVDFVRATGSVAAALEMTTNAGTKMSSGRVIELVAVTENEATIRGRFLDPADAHPFFCGHSAGYYGLVPEVFGYASVIAEVACMGRGDLECVYKLRWSATDVDRPAVDAAAIEVSRARMESFVARFEQLHTLATELNEAEGVDAVLSRITKQAGIAVDAHRYLLAVRASDDDTEPRIHHNGFADESAARFASRLLAGELADSERLVVGEVASKNRTYGRIAALYPAGSTVTDMERRLLSAYARYAASAIEAVASLEATRRDRDTASALLELAGCLAEVRSAAEVASRVAAAVPVISGSDRASVWLWNAENASIELAAECPDGTGVPSFASVFKAADIDLLAALVDHPSPLIIHADGADPYIRQMMEDEGVVRVVVVPIRARGEFLGAVVAGFSPLTESPEDDSRDSNLIARLSGLADQAATALDNARLLDRVRDQALRDPLTGLPNRRLLKDRVEQGLAHGQRHGGKGALLFLDLDKFKTVNDTLGHDAGDDLISEAAGRVAACVRGSDTVARLGGDEFVTFLPDVVSRSDAAIVAQKLLAALRRPFRVAGVDVAISGSVGIAVARDHGDDYAALLKHADAAMYEAKRAGGNTYR